MALPFNRNLKPFARALCKNMTDAEHALWWQRNIGNYIVDSTLSARNI